MKFTLPLAALAAATSVSATSYFPGCSKHKCISQGIVDKFIPRFTAILEHQDSDLGNFTQAMQTMLSDSFQEISDSINSLAGISLGSVTTPSKEEYISETENAPPDSNIQTIFAVPAGCRDIIWHWNFPTVGSSAQPVKGFNYFELNEMCQIETMSIEFNSIAWGADIGFTTTPPATSNSTSTD